VASYKNICGRASSTVTEAIAVYEKMPPPTAIYVNERVLDSLVRRCGYSAYPVMWKADLCHLNERKPAVGGGKQGGRCASLAIITEDEKRAIRVEHRRRVVAVWEATWEVHRR
jgi:hypothetical protein